MSQGVIYIMINPSFEEYVKIGYAADVNKRLDELNRSSAVPFAFRIYATYETEEKLSDVEVHKLIDGLNPDLRSIENNEGKKRVREFYAMSPEDAYSIFKAIAKISGTESKLHLAKMTDEEASEDKEADEIKEERKERFRFSMIGLKPGDVVTFKNDKNITATVVDDTHVLCGKETTSLSGLAEKLMHSKALAGPHYFCYNGVLLNDLREKKK
jgi:plastocyanin